MVPYRPHSALVWPIEEVAGSDGVLGTPAPAGTPSARKGYFEPLTPSAALQRFGILLKLPAAFQVEISDAAKLSAGSEVLIEGRYYTVMGEPEIHRSELDSDHAEVVLEGKDHPIKGV